MRSCMLIKIIARGEPELEIAHQVETPGCGEAKVEDRFIKLEHGKEYRIHSSLGRRASLELAVGEFLYIARTAEGEGVLPVEDGQCFTIKFLGCAQKDRVDAWSRMAIV